MMMFDADIGLMLAVLLSLKSSKCPSFQCNFLVVSILSHDASAKRRCSFFHCFFYNTCCCDSGVSSLNSLLR